MTSNHPHDELKAAARTALTDCLSVREGETLLVVSDPPCRTVGRAFVEAALEMGRYAVYAEIPPMSRSGEEPIAAVSTLMAGFNVVVAATEASLTHTAARRGACAAGARVATMPGIREDMVIRSLSADYNLIARRTERVRDALTAAGSVTVRSEMGTDLAFSILGITAIASTGLIRKPGDWGNLPSGEAYLRPLENTAEGILVVDGSMAGIGKLDCEVIRIVVEKGRAVRVSGGHAAERLDRLLSSAGPKAYVLAEFGVGTNHAARIIGKILEDEKVMGTVHLALGNNLSMGGTNDVTLHLDGIVCAPTVELDGRVVIDGGSFTSEIAGV